MSGMRFRYALEPVLLTRQWHLDAELLALSELNAGLAEARAQEQLVRDKAALAGAAWAASSAGGQALSVDAFVLATRYLGDLASQARAHALRADELTQQRDRMIDSVVAAKRGVEAAQQHRDEMKALFIQQRLSGDFKIADDQWNTVQAGVALHDNSF